METIRLFKKCNYTEEDYKFCISKYLENHVGFNVEKEKVSYLKIDNDGIDSLIVILKDDIRRI